jgi:hypothetical protein
VEVQLILLLLFVVVVVFFFFVNPFAASSIIYPGWACCGLIKEAANARFIQLLLIPVPNSSKWK